ncbi:MAG: FAD-dependent oxidoreductase [Aequorivita sp.]
MKKEIAIVGGGISGLVAAFELSENSELDITIIEASDSCGGKMKGYFNKKTNRFEEHSIRALGSTYFALFDVFYRVGMMDVLTAVDEYIFYESKSGKKVAIDRTESIKLETFKELVSTFDLSLTDMMSLAKKIAHHVNASDEERDKQSHQKAGDVIGIDDFDEHTRQFIINWFGILTGARMESKAVDIMDSFVLMFLPMTESPQLPPGKHSKSYCFNRPTSEVIELLVKKLEARGVKFSYNTRFENIERDSASEKIMLKTEGEKFDNNKFDACIIAVPHETMWKVGLLKGVKKPFDDEWSFGSQFPMAVLPEALVPFKGKSYNLSFDAPWNIVFQIQHKEGFWKDVDFSESQIYNLSATCSSPFNEGSLYGKRFMECTPEESLHEILFQLGITEEGERSRLVKNATVDPIYLDYTEEWKEHAHLETAELGILQNNNHRWVDFSQIYVRSAEDKEIESKTEMEGVYLAGEVVSVPGRWKIPTMEQASMSGKQAAQEVFKYLDIEREVNMEFATLSSTKGYKLMEGILAGLTAISKLVPTKNKENN